jgi:hypothetical protein
MILIPGTKVTISMKGLGVANFNDTTGNWDFAFLRGIKDHNLKIIVREYRIDSPSMIIRNVYDDPKNNWGRIEIKTNIGVNQSPIPDYSINPNFIYDESKGDNCYDSRWITDLSELHGTQLQSKKSITLKKPDSGVSLTFLSVSAATLYSKVLHDEPYWICDTTEETKPVQKYQRVSTSWAGLDIKWSGTNNSTTLIFDGNEEMELTGNLVNGSPDPNLLHYEIEINNNCNQNTATSDFHYYYKHLVAMPNSYDEVFESNTSLLSAEKAHGGKTNDCGIKQISKLESGKSLEEILA